MISKTLSMGLWPLAATISSAPLAGAQPFGRPFQEIREELTDLSERIGDLEEFLDPIEGLRACVRVFDGELGGLPGPHVIFTRCNVHVRSGLGATNGAEQTNPNESTNRLGNLIVGYNEGSCLIDPDSPPGDNPGSDFDERFPRPCLTDAECGERGVCDFGERHGSHNLVVGHQHQYPSFGGILGGRANATQGPQASVSGGYQNRAHGDFATVHGGLDNDAAADASTVLGGSRNLAAGPSSAVLAGAANAASGANSAVVSGSFNEAIGTGAAVVGGGHIVFGPNPDPDGGNTARGDYSVIVGGQQNITGLTGSLGDGYAAAVCGGINNNASGVGATVGGGNANVAAGEVSSVSGGAGRSAPDMFNWAAGGQFESN